MEEYERRKKRSLITGVIVIVALLALVLGVVYRSALLDMYFNLTTSDYVYSNTDCGGHRLFVDEDLGISFEYPESWTVRIEEDDEHMTEINVVGPYTVKIKIFPTEEHPRKYLWSLEETDLDSSSKVDKRWKVEIGGYKGWGWQRFVWVGMADTASDGTYVIEAVTSHGGNMYHLSYSEMDVSQFDDGVCYFEMVMNSLHIYD